MKKKRSPQNFTKTNTTPSITKRGASCGTFSWRNVYFTTLFSFWAYLWGYSHKPDLEPSLGSTRFSTNTHQRCNCTDWLCKIVLWHQKKACLADRSSAAIDVSCRRWCRYLLRNCQRADQRSARHGFWQGRQASRWERTTPSRGSSYRGKASATQPCIPEREREREREKGDVRLTPPLFEKKAKQLLFDIFNTLFQTGRQMKVVCIATLVKKSHLSVVHGERSEISNDTGRKEHISSQVDVPGKKEQFCMKQEKQELIQKNVKRC